MNAYKKTTTSKEIGEMLGGACLFLAALGIILLAVLGNIASLSAIWGDFHLIVALVFTTLVGFGDLCLLGIYAACLADNSNPLD